MRDTYFDLSECTEDEINELKGKLFWADGDELEGFSRADMEKIESCECAEDIPFELVEKKYGIYSFVDEDFFCNC